MNKITKNQFAAMLLITDAFTLFCFIGSISLVTAAGFVSGTVLQFILAFPVIKLCENNNSIEKSGKTVKTIYLAYLILWGGMLFSMLWKAAEAIYIPYENSGGFWGKLLIAGLIAVICLYASSTGIKAISRSAVIAMAIGALCLLVVIVSASFGSDWNNLITTETDDSFISEISKGFVLSGGLGSFTVLLGFTKGDPLINSAYYFTGKTILTAAVTLTAVLVAGGIMKITDFPVVTAAQLSQPFPVQRIDSLFLIIFAVFAVFSIAIQSFSAAYLLKEIFPSFRKLRSSSVLVMMIGSAFLFIGTNPYNILYASIIIAVLFAVPLFILIKRSVSE